MLSDSWIRLKNKESNEEQLVLKCQIWNWRWPNKILKSWREGKRVLQNTGTKSLMNSPPRLALFTDQVFGGRRPLPGCLLKPWLQQTLPWKRTVIKNSSKTFSANKAGTLEPTSTCWWRSRGSLQCGHGTQTPCCQNGRPITAVLHLGSKWTPQKKCLPTAGERYQSGGRFKVVNVYVGMQVELNPPPLLAACYLMLAPVSQDLWWQVVYSQSPLQVRHSYERQAAQDNTGKSSDLERNRLIFCSLTLIYSQGGSYWANIFYRHQMAFLFSKWRGKGITDAQLWKKDVTHLLYLVRHFISDYLKQKWASCDG